LPEIVGIGYIIVLYKFKKDQIMSNNMDLMARMQVANELSILTGIDEDKADRLVSGFLNGSTSLSIMREYWNAKSAKAAAEVVKKYWM